MRKNGISTSPSVIPRVMNGGVLRNKTPMDFSASQENGDLQTGSEKVEKIPVHPLQLFIYNEKPSNRGLHSILRLTMNPAGIKSAEAF
jgi:hypothetical protein